MTWDEAQMSLQLLAELGVGAPARAQVYAAKAAEDAAFDQGVQAVTGDPRRGTG